MTGLEGTSVLPRTDRQAIVQHSILPDFKAVLNKCHLSEDALKTEAEKITGLSDWETEDNVEEPFRLLLKSYQENDNLTVAGKLAAHGYLLMPLINRLSFNKTYKKYPDIFRAPIPRPLIVVGMPRTGTTFFHNLLSQDPEARYPRLWELMMPFPPAKPETLTSDWRIGFVENILQATYRNIPELLHIHRQDAQAPDECYYLFFNSFAAINFATIGPQPDYQRWLFNADMRPAYRTYKKYLQIMQTHVSGSHWVLKCPQHLFFLDSLLEVIPNANIVFIHRDPIKSVGSNCSLYAAARKKTEKHPDLRQLGKDCLFECKLAMDRAMVARDALDSARFYDVYFKDIVKNPMKTVRKIYQYFEYDYTPEAERDMVQWLKKSQKKTKGAQKHDYHLEDYGLTTDHVNWLFHSYLERYQMDEHDLMAG